MELSHEQCYEAIQARDATFDGSFFTGVKTTGIYCRPICPARTPKRDNVTFFPTASAAEEAGFRACLRCRPESAPGTPAWLGTRATTKRALRLIEQGALDEAGLDRLADRLGIGERQLRRLLRDHLDATPLALAQHRRAQLARDLIERTDLTMSQIAHEAGFGSVRRFNEVMRATFECTPTELRRRQL